MAGETYTTAAEAFVAAVIRRDIAESMTYLSDDVVIRNPLFEEVFDCKVIGKSAMEMRLDLVTGCFDGVEVTHVVRDAQQVLIAMDIRIGSETLNGHELYHHNEQGLVDSIMITWRPINAIVQLQNRVARKIGIPALKLVPVEDEV